MDEKEKKKEKREEDKMREKLLLLFSFPEDPTVDVHRSKMQSSSSRRELRVEIGIEEFQQSPRRKRLFLHGFFIPSLKSHIMA